MHRRDLLRAGVVLPMLMGASGALAQTPSAPAPPSTPPADDRKLMKPEQLDQLLAPIALYPDALLSQVLIATSYPLEIVEADRWVKANTTLKGDAAVAAVKDKTWDVSVMSLVAFPSVLTQLSDHLDWTQNLGDAMIAQEADVAASIQRLRARAADAGNLKTSPQQTVTTQGAGPERTIVIEPASPDVVYVPSYNPTWAYGTWPYPAYPPTYYPPPAGYGYGTALTSGILWGVGIAATAAMFSSWNWNNWYRGSSYVNVNANRAVNIDRNFDRNRYVNNNNRWQHDPGHRRGVAYRDNATRQQFNQQRPGAAERQQFRGQVADRTPGQGPQRPQGGANLGGGHQGGGNVANRAATNHPNVQPRQQGGQRPQVQNQARPAQGDRPTALSGTNRGQQVNREAARGRAQQGRAASHPRPSGGGARGGGGGGARGGGGMHGGGGRR